MKKTLSIIVATSLLFVLAGCGHSSAKHTHHEDQATEMSTNSSSSSSSSAATSSDDNDATSSAASSAANTSSSQSATSDSANDHQQSAAAISSQSAANSSSQAAANTNNNQSTGQVTNSAQAINVLRVQLGAKAKDMQLVANGTSTVNGQTVYNIAVYQGSSKAPSAAYLVSQSGKVTQQW